MPSCRLVMLGLTLGTIIACSAVSGIAFAQSAPSSGSDNAASTMVTSPRKPDPQHQANRLARKLQLNAQQTSAIEPILQSRMQQTQQLRADGSLTPRDRHTRMRAINQDADSRLQAVLTDSQRQQYQQIMQQAKQRRQARKNGAANSSAAPDSGE